MLHMFRAGLSRAYKADRNNGAVSFSLPLWWCSRTLALRFRRRPALKHPATTVCPCSQQIGTVSIVHTAFFNANPSHLGSSLSSGGMLGAASFGGRSYGTDSDEQLVFPSGGRRTPQPSPAAYSAAVLDGGPHYHPGREFAAAHDGG